MKKKLVINKEEIDVDVTEYKDHHIVGNFHGRPFDMKLLNVQDGVARVINRGEFQEIAFVRVADGLCLRLPSGRDYHVRLPETKRKRSSAERHDGGPVIVSPMPGKVLKILVAAGDVVTKGRPVLVLEAMKMEHTLKAPMDGSVAAVKCSVGDVVQAAQELVTLAAVEK